MSALRASIRGPARAVLRALRRVWYRGRARHCTVCGGRFRRFLPAGVVPRPDARCPGCDSLERHRLAALLLARERRGAAAGRTLHIAPEPAMVRLLDGASAVHVTGDLYAPDVAVRFDLTRLPFGRATFTLVYCSHVLEHVEDDAAAMREMRRVLAADGVALVQIPIEDGREQTLEDVAVRSPAERLRRFGQDDHVRVYGLDVERRLRDAGFDVRAVRAADVAPADELVRAGLDRTEPAFLCRPREDA